MYTVIPEAQAGEHQGWAGGSQGIGSCELRTVSSEFSYSRGTELTRGFLARLSFTLRSRSCSLMGFTR